MTLLGFELKRLALYPERLEALLGRLKACEVLAEPRLCTSVAQQQRPHLCELKGALRLFIKRVVGLKLMLIVLDVVLNLA